jgi:hypothetical protein
VQNKLPYVKNVAVAGVFTRTGNNL